MNPLLQVSGQAPGKYRVGQAVRLKHGFRGMIGEVVEDHGPIGVHGRRLYAVKLRLDPWNEHTSPYPEESLEAVVDESVSVSHEKRVEDSEKETIILMEVEMRIETLGGHLSDERKASLKMMRKIELQQLAQDLKGTRSSREAITMTVQAITASEAARRAAEEQKYDATCGPAKMDSDL